SIHKLTVSKYFLRVSAHARRRARTSGPRADECARAASTKGIFGAGDENAGAAGLAPDALVEGSRRAIVVVARNELAPVDKQLAVKEMQLFYARMSMRGVTRAGREADQHADPVVFRVAREQFAFDPGRDLFPFRLRPLPRRRQHRLFPGLFGDTKGKPRLQRCRRTQHVGGPGNEPIDDRAQAVQLPSAIAARGDMGFGRGNLARRQRLSGIRTRYLALLAGVPFQLDHDVSASAVSACRSLCSPERMRVLMVPSG